MSPTRTAATRTLRAAVVLAATALVASACGSENTAPGEERAPEVPASGGMALSEAQWAKVAAVEQDGGFVSRSEHFSSLQQLRDSSTLIVVASPVSAQPHATDTGGGPPLSFLDVTMNVSATLMGPDSESVTVFAEGPDKFISGKRYLLFLRPLKEGTDVYAVTGYVAGLYEFVGAGQNQVPVFGRVDGDSPELPQAVFTKGREVQPVP